MQNDDVDAKAALKYLEELLKDSEWKKVMHESFEICNKEIGQLAEKYQKLSNFPKTTCNIKYSAVVDCMDIAAFAVSFLFLLFALP